MMGRFIELETYEHGDVEHALGRDDPAELQQVVVTVAMEDGDYTYAEQLCIRLARHADATVRGNALLGLGHIARRFGHVSVDGRALVKAGILDQDPHIRLQAESAEDDIETFANESGERP